MISTDADDDDDDDVCEINVRRGVRHEGGWLVA